MKRGDGHAGGELLKKLEGGDRRSIGRVDDVIADVLADPSLFDELFSGILTDDPLVRMRAADAVEKITSDHPEYLHPYKRVILTGVAAIDQQEVRWHAAVILPRLKLTHSERLQVIDILDRYLTDRSSIVRTMAMQGLADIAMQDKTLRPGIIGRLEDLTAIGTPAMRSRGRKLLERLRSASP